MTHVEVINYSSRVITCVINNINDNVIKIRYAKSINRLPIQSSEASIDDIVTNTPDWFLVRTSFVAQQAIKF